MLIVQQQQSSSSLIKRRAPAGSGADRSLEFSGSSGSGRFFFVSARALCCLTSWFFDHAETQTSSNKESGNSNIEADRSRLTISIAPGLARSRIRTTSSGLYSRVTSSSSTSHPTRRALDPHQDYRSSARRPPASPPSASTRIFKRGSANPRQLLQQHHRRRSIFRPVFHPPHPPAPRVSIALVELFFDAAAALLLFFAA